MDQHDAGLSATPFMTATEAAEFLNMPMATLYGLTSRREIPHFKRGRVLLFDRAELDAWMRQMSVPVKPLRENIPLGAY